MTGLDAIEWADELCPNQYSTEQKLAWLSDHDGRVWREVLRRYREDGEPTEYTDGTETLLIGAPYARGVYGNFLCAKIAEANAESSRYNQYAAAYNDTYKAWADTYNREHKSRPGGWWTF